MANINFLEKDLETLIENTPPELLCEKGLPVRPGSVFIRQTKLGNYGISDLISVYAEQMNGFVLREIGVYELKQNEINVASLLQVSRYLKAIRSFYHDEEAWHLDISGVLIGKSVDLKSDFVYLAAQCHNISIFTYGCDINGFWFKRFNPEQYGFTDPGLSNVDSLIKYQFDKMLGRVNDFDKVDDLPY